ncbi:MAG: DUF2975 domain-containing protein [Planctomycetales bacterium]|nr:DUF2975 domain-containing protein [Planctomycetales bacterium]
MNTATESSRVERRLARWSLALGMLAWLGMANVVVTVLAALFGEHFALLLPDDEGLTLMTAQDLSLTQRLAVVAILSTTQWCWFWIMFQVWLISRSCARGEILAPRVVTLLRRFAGGLFAMGFCELMSFPLVSWLLHWDWNAVSMADWWAISLGSGMVESFMAGLLMVIIATIFKLGLQMREDLELTV